ncbi:DUF1667 domain-containing protein [Caloramator sp. CAR-1]|jgi:CxxC motif-containing protein|uniref:DUF1667 domain-containing protein n=1 Tax=Caloramator sp. CAR-1 TaxID=3062777 RepID=UPI0026E3EDA6|nr:DUF1667 domain-containing protein [Caloramator sp. CAR-1]MDO6356008.1 DUF1667 domain-containing protein [Caloramator sp. CAR-1]
MTKYMTCINCPLGCQLQVEINGEIKVTGNKCKKGEDYAKNEIINPTRIITTTVKVKGGDRPLLSVKTDREVPKSKIFDIMKEINKVEAKAPINIGDIIIENVLGTGANVVATSRVERIKD